MPPKAAKRAELAERIAERLLAAGVAQIPLRDLAADLGTSDRMLLYYFTDKADLVRASLEAVSAQLAGMLEAAAPPVRVGPDALLVTLLGLMGADSPSPVMNVWADIAARGGRGEEPFRQIASQSVARWLGWIDQRLDIEDEDKRRNAAAAILTVVEGARQLEAAAPGAARHVGATLSPAFHRA